MATLTIQAGELRKAYWVIEDTTDADALEISINGSPFQALAWEGNENWSLLLQGPNYPAPTGYTVPLGLSEGTIRSTETGEVLLHDAGLILVENPCVGWPIDWTCSPPSESTSPEQIYRAERLAASTLTALTLGRVGGCPIVVRPCARSCWDNFPYQGRLGWSPHVNGNGDWVNSCGCGSNCHCGAAMSEVVLDAPVGYIEEVWVDGAILDPSAYRVDNGNRLVRTDGGVWPSCQDMSQGPHGVDAFSVTYLNGYPVDEVGAYAGGLLASEYLAACTNGRCGLPSGVTQIVRQGVTMTVSVDLFAEGLTGIPAVDSYTAGFNPNRLRVRPRVYSPDVPTVRRTTWGY